MLLWIGLGLIMAALIPYSIFFVGISIGRSLKRWKPISLPAPQSGKHLELKSKV